MLIIINLDQVKITMHMNEESIIKIVKMNFEILNTRMGSLSKKVSDIQASLDFDSVNNKKTKDILLSMQELKSSLATISAGK